MKIGVKTFVLPGTESEMEKYFNNPLIVVVISERYFAAKEGFLVAYIQFEDYREEEGAFD